mgnify:CR=1 FL=1
MTITEYSALTDAELDALSAEAMGWHITCHDRLYDPLTDSDRIGGEAWTNSRGWVTARLDAFHPTTDLNHAAEIEAKARERSGAQFSLHSPHDDEERWCALFWMLPRRVEAFADTAARAIVIAALAVLESRTNAMGISHMTIKVALPFVN